MQADGPQPVTRRKFEDDGTAAAATLVASFVRTAGAAGSLRVGFWDHWVPGANTAMTQICEEWAAKEKVNLTIEPWWRWGLAHADKLRAWRSSHF